MKKTIKQLENELIGRKRIENAAFIAAWDFDLFIEIKGSFWSEKFKR